MVEITLQQIEEYINNALNLLYENDGILFDYEEIEIAIVHRFAVYFESILREAGIDLACDIEYGKDMNGTTRVWISNPNGDVFRPDFVVHRREDNSENLLIIEFKTPWSGTDNFIDLLRITEATSSKGDYHYRYGASRRNARDLESPISSM